MTDSTAKTDTAIGYYDFFFACEECFELPGYRGLLYALLFTDKPLDTPKATGIEYLRDELDAFDSDPESAWHSVEQELADTTWPTPAKAAQDLLMGYESAYNLLTKAEFIKQFRA